MMIRFRTDRSEVLDLPIKIDPTSKNLVMISDWKRFWDTCMTVFLFVVWRGLELFPYFSSFHIICFETCKFWRNSKHCKEIHVQLLFIAASHGWNKNAFCHMCFWSGRVRGIKIIRPKKYLCMFQVSRPYLGFCLDPKHFIVSCEQNVVKFTEKMGKNILKNQGFFWPFWERVWYLSLWEK